MRLHGTRWRYCQECGEPVDGAANVGTDAEPLCGLCPARRRLAQMWRQGVTHEQIAALQRVWRQGFTHEQITALQRVQTREIDRRYEQMRREEGEEGEEGAGNA